MNGLLTAPGLQWSVQCKHHSFIMTIIQPAPCTVIIYSVNINIFKSNISVIGHPQESCQNSQLLQHWILPVLIKASVVHGFIYRDGDQVSKMLNRPILFTQNTNINLCREINELEMVIYCLRAGCRECSECLFLYNVKWVGYLSKMFQWFHLYLHHLLRQAIFYSL